MADTGTMRTGAQSPTEPPRTWVLDVQGLFWPWGVWIVGLIVSTVVCRLLLEPYNISKTWPFELWYGLHVVLGAICIVLLWRGTGHLEIGVRRLGIIAVHATLGFITWVALVIVAFWSEFLPFIK
jgi:hypothetical protein